MEKLKKKGDYMKNITKTIILFALGLLLGAYIIMFITTGNLLNLFGIFIAIGLSAILWRKNVK